MKRRLGFTLEQHKQLATLLREFRNHVLIKAAVNIPNAYGLNCKEARLANRALEAIDNLRSAMDSRLADEHTELSDQEFSSIYYGAEKNPEETR